MSNSESVPSQDDVRQERSASSAGHKLKLFGIVSVLAVTGTMVVFHVAPGNAATSPELAPAGAPSAEPAPPMMELAQAAPVASVLPGGASALSETYQNWRVACAQQATAPHCSLSQSQVQDIGQRVLTVELTLHSENTIAGIIVLPFGLALTAGASLQIDDNPAGQTLPFRTCLPVGCVVPVTFDPDAIAMLRAGVMLNVTTTSDAGQQIPFKISLAGFSAALDRLTALAG